jgi:hypothetical protein
MGAPAVVCGPVAEPPERLDLRIPLGGLSRHVVRRRRLRRALLRWPVLAAAAGAGAALAGVLLATAEPQVEVRLDAAGYRIDGEQLADRGAGAYEGRDGAALVIDRRPRGAVAGASALLDGRHMTGRCEPAAGGEACRFALDGGALTAADERTTYGWHRRYSDGRTVAILLTGDRDAPVPFAVGR